VIFALEKCPTCGERIPPSAGECLFCPPVQPVDTGPSAPEPSIAAPSAPEPSPPAPPAIAAPPPPSDTTVAPPDTVVAPSDTVVAPSDTERDLGLLLFEAEEQLARGQAEKALVLASRAVRARPAHLTARALYERSRRELLRGQRRVRLEGRIQQAQAMLAQGDAAGAERIVVSALKLIPDHATALALFGRLKERRLAAGTMEAEAEREIEKLALAQAGHALVAARSAMRDGWPRRALTIVRRALRRVPDHAELLALLREVESGGRELDLEAARRRAGHAQVRHALEVLAAGRFQESLGILRAVLAEDPDNARAQFAVQQARRAWLARHASPSPATAPPEEPPLPPPPPLLPRPPLATGRAAPLPAPPPEEPFPTAALLPRRRATPLVVILGCAVAAFALLLYLSGQRGARSGPTAAETSPSPPVRSGPPPTTAPGPLAAAPPDLRAAVEAALAAYARALETRDPESLAQARPDLSAERRAALLARFDGALNVAVDLRVIDAVWQDQSATLSVLRTDVIVGGRGGSAPPQEETLRFERRSGAWSIAGGGAR
jgi:tetratricopeptide (TPR) repeat protein